MTQKDLQLTHDRWESIVLNRAIEVYGVNNQIDQAEQEMIELLDAEAGAVGTANEGRAEA